MYMLALNFQLSFHYKFSSGWYPDLKRKRGRGWVSWVRLRIGIDQIEVSAEQCGVEVKVVVRLSLEGVKVTSQIESFACGQVLTIRSSYP